MRFSKRLAELGNGVFARIDQAKNAYQREPGQRSLIDLSLGSSDLRPPVEVLEAMASAIDQPASAGYCLEAGTAPFRQAVADWCEQRFGVSVDPDRHVQLLGGVSGGHGSSAPGGAGSRRCRSASRPLLSLPPWWIALGGASLLSLPLLQERNWEPDLEAITPATWEQLKLFVLGYPHNPTARLGSQELLDAVMHRGVSHELVIAHDNPYVDLALEGEAPVLLRSPGWRDWGIEFFSFSKGWCLGGFRLAFAVGAEPLIQALRQVKAVVDFNQSLALQQGAIHALRHCASWPATLHPVYRERRDRVLAVLRSHGWSIPTPEMALYLWLPLPPQLQLQGMTGESLARQLLERSGVALTPGSGFGPAGRDWLRMALVRPVGELEQAAHRLLDALP